MPEIKLFKNIQFSKTEVDPSTIKFKSKLREKQRKASIVKRALEEPATEEELQAKRKQKTENAAWSAQKARKEKRDVRKEKSYVEEAEGTGKSTNIQVFKLKNELGVVLLVEAHIGHKGAQALLVHLPIRRVDGN